MRHDNLQLAAYRNLVKFVRLDAPLADILGERPDENSRQTAAEKFRDIISRCKEAKSFEKFRIVVKRQSELWEDGLRIGRLFELQRQRDLADGVKSDSADDDDNDATETNGEFEVLTGSGYGGGKWGKYLRAPNLYFRVRENYANSFVPFGEIATIRRGITSGCDAYFMPRDVSEDFLGKYSKLEWNDAPLQSHCKRADVESGKIRLIKTSGGDETVHPIEKEFLVPEIHNLMRIKTAEIRTTQVLRFETGTDLLFFELKAVASPYFMYLRA